jgi:hypothetical protein
MTTSPPADVNVSASASVLCAHFFNAAFVVAEDHVEHPVQAVLDRPAAADHGCELARRKTSLPSNDEEPYGIDRYRPFFGRS